MYKSQRGYHTVIIVETEDRVIYNSWEVKDGVRIALHVNGSRAPADFHRDFSFQPK